MHREASARPTGLAQQGFLLAASPLPLLVLNVHLAVGPVLVAPLLALAQLAGALLLRRRPVVARLLLTTTILGTGLLGGWRLARTPLGALGVFVTVLGLLAWIWGWTLPPPAADAPQGRARGSAWGAALVCLLGLLSGLSSPWAWAACGLSLLLLAAVMLGRRPTGAPVLEGAARWSDFIFASPARTLVLTFLAVIAAGTVLLVLPFSAARAPIGLLDALFTSTSATCVTGLVVLDTPTDLGAFGQAVILGLIQVGGLGIMIFSVAGMAITGRRLSLRQESAAVELVGIRDRSRVTEAARNVLAVTFLAEAAGALLLTVGFLSAGDRLGAALWRAVFTAVSAFCNAGFALQSESLIPYQEHVGVVLVVALLVVLGGLGPAVVRAAPRWIRGGTAPLDARLVLWTTLLLLVPSALLLLAVEWGNTLSRMGPGARLANALFLSTTPRTAGFNSVDTAALRPTTLWLTMVLMFIGGSPASTAGGIKTTTVALMLLMIHAAMTGRTHLRAFGFRVSQPSVYRAAAIAALALLTVVGVVAVLQLTQEMPLDMAAFESISALGTVGLSIGGTARLDAVGKLVVAATMFAGRVGPLTLFMILSARTASDRFELPEEEVAVG
jgi:trk system potassium uptake protein TrkH